MYSLRLISSMFILNWYLGEAADLQYMKTAITDHFSDTRYHDAPYSQYKDKAKQFIYDEFIRLGLDTEIHTFRDTAISTTATFHTVIGVLNGTHIGTSKDKIIGLGAHYDTVNTTKGVDDNGSGVAALLEVAKQLTDMNKKGTRRNNTILLVSFDLEEYGGLSGSRNFIQSWLSQWLQKTYGTTPPEYIHGAIILDTIMEYNTSSFSQTVPKQAEAIFQAVFPDTLASIKSDNYEGDFLNLIYRKTTNDSKLAAVFSSSWAAAMRSEYELEEFRLPFDDFESLSDIQKIVYIDFMRSDHFNFWNAGYPGVFLTDSANFRGDMIQCYHKPCDKLDVMLTDDNLKFLGKTADAIAMTMHTLSEPSVDDTSDANKFSMKMITILVMILIGKMILTDLIHC